VVEKRSLAAVCARGMGNAQPKKATGTSHALQRSGFNPTHKCHGRLLRAAAGQKSDADQHLFGSTCPPLRSQEQRASRLLARPIGQQKVRPSHPKAPCSVFCPATIVGLRTGGSSKARLMTKRRKGRIVGDQGGLLPRACRTAFVAHLGCAQRFIDSVDKAGGGDPQQSGMRTSRVGVKNRGVRHQRRPDQQLQPPKSSCQQPERLLARPFMRPAAGLGTGLAIHSLLATEQSRRARLNTTDKRDSLAPASRPLVKPWPEAHPWPSSAAA